MLRATTTQTVLETQREFFYAEQTRLLFANAPTVFGIATLNAVFVVFVLWGQVRHEVLLVWLFGVLLVVLAGARLARRFARISPPPTESRPWVHRYFRGVAVAGVLWGTAGVLLYVPGSVAHQVFLALVLGGLAAGAMAVLAAFRNGFYLFAVPTLLPLAVRFAIESDAVHYAISAVLLVFTVSLSSASRHAYAIIAGAIRRWTENLGLVRYLQNLNEQLELEVALRKQAEEALRQGEQRFRHVAENLADWVWEIDADGCFTFASPEVERVLGVTPDEMVTGMRFSDLLADTRHQKAYDAALAGAEETGRLTGLVVSCPRRQGGSITLRLDAMPIRNDLGERKGWRGVAKDVTEELRREDEARHEQMRLIQTNKMAALGTLVSGVAHEVNNPNNLILFNAPLIENAWRDARAALDAHFRRNPEFTVAGLPYSEMRSAVPRLISDIHDGALRIRNIVASLKDFARAPNDDAHTEVEINEVVHKTLPLVSHLIKRRTDRFEMDLGEELPAIHGDAQKLEQVLVNLLVNALESLPRRDRGVRLVTEPDSVSGLVNVRIEDQGVGIAPEDLGRITEPFFTTKQASGGTGLGLAIAHSLVREHGGEIALDSEPGKGTSVVVTLPSAEQRHDAWRMRATG